MRILQFAPGRYRNLPSAPVFFTLNTDAQPVNGCSIRFLVGLNGTGKTNILRFLASIFLTLDEDFRRPRPENPAYNLKFGLAYQLRGDTIIIRSDGQGRSGVEFTINGDKRAKGDLPDRDRVMPTTMLIYTSGNVDDWHVLVNPEQVEAEGDTEIEINLSQLRLDEEVAPGYVSKEIVAQPEDEQDVTGDTAALSVSRVVLVESRHLRFALLAALLDYQATNATANDSRQAFQEVLAQVDVNLVGFSLQIDPGNLPVSPLQRRQLSQLYNLATLPLSEWDHHLLVFDLADINADDGKTTLEGLHDGPVNDPFDFFRLLVDLQQAGTLRGTNLILNYTPRDSQNGESRTLLSDNLSDGEFAFIARMALIYLLHEDECLFLLDEPETHFNDDWKRNLVDSIERALAGTNSEVIMTSHASITLTDAFPEEVILMTAAGQEAVPLTLASEPGEVLMRLFGADRTVGKRAQRRIEEALERGDRSELEALLNEVGVGYYRFRIVEKLSGQRDFTGTRKDNDVSSPE